ncbi:putative VanW family protein [[Clostridium] ultunense Esp]|uniref:Putative VanW family protein n=1 Tax=[Clostridium] ultunense Esp TaxID=1288971 RepID=M1ZAH8_9FIRM|nr:VanW family protein [Schnuerera ultunensis]CCQ95251.1 putative VanW family protein [[Clostridium] ultunense Esp]SHD75863.1 putative VanW family protein [[Clostridium] ultunense Esp]
MEGTNNKTRIILILAIILLAIILGLGFYGYFKVLSTDLIYEGVKVDQYDLSYMSKEEAFNFIKDKKEEEISRKHMRLIYLDKEYNYGLKELGFYFDYGKAIDRAYGVGREGNLFNRLKEIVRIKRDGVEISLDSNLNMEKIDHIVENISQDIDKEPKDAEFHFNGGNIQVTEEIIGKTVDKDKLRQMMYDNIHSLDIIQIPVEDIIPKITKSLLSRINGIIGEYSTSFKGSSQNRIENIRLSANAIKGKILMPGESMSFNETTGPRAKKYGYKEANVIIAGEFTPDVGGGVCQTSTTLYNALLLADIAILERSPHSIPAKYVKFGQDAAVAFGFLDLKFRNDFDFPIYFDSKVLGDRVYFYVYGDRKSKDYTIKIEPEIVETIPAKEEIVLDKTLEPGSKVLVQQGRTGYRVNTYKSIIKNGKTISKDLITKDFYRPRNFIYRVGEEPSTTTSTDTDSGLNNLIEDDESENIIEDGDIEN